MRIISLSVFPNAKQLDARLWEVKRKEKILLSNRIIAMAQVEFERVAVVMPVNERDKIDECLQAISSLPVNTSHWRKVCLPDCIDPATTDSIGLHNIFGCEGLDLDMEMCMTAAMVNLVVNGYSAINNRDPNLLLAGAVGFVLEVAYDAEVRDSASIDEPIQTAIRMISSIAFPAEQSTAPKPPS